MAQEDDPISTIEGAPKRIADFLMELYKVMRDKKQQEMMQQQQQANQEAMQKQQQQFMMEQNERLMDVMRQSGLPDTDGTRGLAKSGLTRMERLAEDEVQTQAKLEDVNKKIGAIDKEQRSLMSDPVDLDKVKERLGQLDTQKQASDKSYLENLKHLNKREGLSPDEMRSELEKLNNQKKEFDQAIFKEEEELLQTQFENTPLAEVEQQLQDLDQQQLDSDNAYKKKTDDLVQTAGMEPDELFKELEALKAEKLHNDENFGVQRKGLEDLQAKAKMTPDEKVAKIKALHEEKAGLMKTKAGLTEKMGGIKKEVGELSQAKELMQGMGQGQGQGMGNQVKVGGPMGKMVDGMSSFVKNGGITGSVIYGGFDLVKKAAANPNSVASSILKEMQEGGKKLGTGLKQAVTSGRAFKH